MKKLLFTAFILSFFLLACEPSENQKHSKQEQTENTEWQKLKEETLAIHDSAMVYMGTLKNLQKELKKKIEATSDENLRQELENAVLELENADKGMWDWMHAYKAPDEKKTPADSLMRFFQAEHEKIVKVHQDILNAMKKAKKYLNETR